jgi:transcriptional regulator with XRE-family HTH domain
MPFLHNLKQLREEYPMSIEELGAKSGVSRTTIRKLEKLHQEAKSSTARKLAEALEAESAELMDSDRQLSARLSRSMNRKTTLAKTLGMQPGKKDTQDLEEKSGRERLIEDLMKRGRTREEVEEEIKRVEEVMRKGTAR